MNKRMQQLAGQAFDRVVPYTWTRLDHDEIQKLQECFAELIVRECVAVCQDLDGEDNTDAKSGRQDCAVEIREHFGVEERMSLKQAAEMALKYFEDAHGLEDAEVAIKEALRQALAQPDHIRDATKKVEPEWIEDGFGNMWQKCGKKDCGRFVVKIGKVDCWDDDCLEAKGKHENLL